MQKLIRYDRETKDFAAYLNGEYIGSFATRGAAEVELDRLAYEQLRRAA
jgi:hypothetical protein